MIPIILGAKKKVAGMIRIILGAKKKATGMIRIIFGAKKKATGMIWIILRRKEAGKSEAGSNTERTGACIACRSDFMLETVYRRRRDDDEKFDR